jgi:hypothetical protein
MWTGSVTGGLAALALCIGAHSQAQNPPTRTIHVFVALADNEHQGIVPVPARIGNGMDPEHNLYWGAAAGGKTFFTRSADCSLRQGVEKPKPAILERCIFKHCRGDVYLVADAYRGLEIRQAILDFFGAAATNRSIGNECAQARGPRRIESGRLRGARWPDGFSSADRAPSEKRNPS